MLYVLLAINNILNRVILWLATVIIALMVLALSLSALTRYVSGIGYDWFIELPPILICWLVFPLLGPLLRNGQHIQVDFLSAVLSPKWVLAIKLFNNVVVFIGAILFFKAGIDATVLYRNMGQMLEIELAIPMWWMYLAFPIGFLILIVFSFELALDDLERLILVKREFN